MMRDYKFYLNLSERESIEFAKNSVKEIKELEQLEDLLRDLALFTNGECLKPFYPELIKNEMFYPPEIYLHANEQIADELIELVENGSEYVNHLLCCLAWIGTPNVMDFFVAASLHKPDWTKELYVLPKEYADQAGWIIHEDKRKRSLINRDVVVFARQNFDDGNEIQSETFVERTEVCKFCGNNLTTVFKTVIEASPIPFSTCLLCAGYEPFYLRVDNEDDIRWHDANKKWEHFDKHDMQIEKIRENTLVITNEERRPEFTISQFVAISKSQIGGYPTWVQDADYLNCPDCHQKMQYIGQVDMEDVEDYNEGIYYFHYCEKCRITGTNYQQT